MGDWVKGTRQEQIDQGKRILNTLDKEIEDAEGKKVKISVFMGIPDKAVTDFATPLYNADAALERGKQEGRGSDAANGAIRDAFPPYIEALRSLKKRYLLMPPATHEIWAEFGFAEPDGVGTPVGESKTVPVGKGSNPLPGVIRIRTEPLDASLFERRSASYFQVRYGVVDPTKEGRKYIKKAPESPDDLIEQEDRRRRDEDYEFSAADAGKRVFFCMRYVNSKGKPGKWGPIISMIIT